MKKRIISILLILLMLLSIAGCGEKEKEKTTTSNQEATNSVADGTTDAPTQEPTDASTDVPTDVPTDAPTDAPTQEPTSGTNDGEITERMKAALAYAKQFSTGKYEIRMQLEFSDYTEAEIKYALDNCGIDWKKEALEQVKAMINSTDLVFSKQLIVNHLYDLTYTQVEVDYALNNSDYYNVDWKVKALNYAKQYLEYNIYSKQGLKEILEESLFIESEAQYAVDNCGANWNEQAVQMAEIYKGYVSLSRDELINQFSYRGNNYMVSKKKADEFLELKANSDNVIIAALLKEGFTQSEAEYGYNATSN